MKFDLKNYITEKYLFEKLQSDILINELMQDNMFKYYKIKIPGNSYYQISELFKEIDEILTSIFNISTYSYYPNIKDIHVNKHIYYNKEYISTDEQMIALNKKYMNLINEYQKKVSNIFVKPDPQLFKILFKEPKTTYFYSLKHVDLFNLTDDMFIKYTYKDIKKDKNIKNIMSDYIDNYLIFYITADDKKIQACSYKNYIVLYALDNPMYYSRYTSDPYNYFNKHVDKNNIIYNDLKYTLSNGNVLSFPIIKKYDIYDNKINHMVGFDYIYKELDVNNSVICPQKDKVGKFYSKSSILQKNTNWGKNENDYIIIYTPTGGYLDPNKKYVTSTYNDGEGKVRYYTSPETSYNDIMSDTDKITKKQQQQKDFREAERRTYKWIKTILNKYLPYAGGKQNKIWEYLKKLQSTDYSSLYNDDEYNNEIVQENNKRYNLLLQQLKSIKKFDVFKEQLKLNIEKISNYVKLNKNYLLQIKQYFKTDKEKYKILMTLYITYMQTLNNTMSLYNKINIEIKKLNDSVNIKYIKNNYLTRSTTTSIERIRNNITNDLNNLTNMLNQVETFKNKLDDEL